MAANGKSLKKWAIRAAGSGVALALIFWFLPREAIFEGFARLTAPLFFGVLAAFMACHVAAATKWWLLMDRAMPFVSALRAHFAGLVANLCLPGAAGGDAVRAAVAHVALRDGPKVAAAAIGDRLIDMAGLACLCLTGFLLMHGQGASPALVLTMAGLVFGGAIAALFIFPKAARAIWSRFPKLPARDLAFRLADAFGAIASKPALMLFALALSAAIQAVLIWLSIQLALVVGVNVPTAAWFFAWPLAKIIATLPLSLGGLGVRESTLAAFLVPFGASAAQVVASGLAWQGVLYLAGALGALVLTLSGGSIIAPKRESREISE
jgi:glycosyltransferase 2 family protein